VREFDHRPVLLDAAVDALCPRPGGRFLDGTVGGGGHASAILEQSGPDGLLIGIDRDPAALAAASARLASYGDRFQPIRGRMGGVADLVADWAPFDGLLVDLGVSSPQLDQPERGFSFQHDGPVDMRMDPDHPEDASTLLERLDQPGLVRILREYGEEPRARQIARAILAGRPWHSTVALADCVARSSGYRNSRTHPATRTFQALRIAVNDELGELERLLDASLRLVRVGGRVAVISFHSLEDRMVKHHFRAAAGKQTPKDAFGHPIEAPVGRLVHPRGTTGRDADPDNPRARSARLRVLEITRSPSL
jgi:16S rRNA (cytosine1402-N4)-methyltransferase